MQTVSRAILAICVCALAGCAISGPAAIRNGRQLYNDALVATNNQQVLAMILRMRYQEPAALLAVSSVTANIRFQANTSAQFGIGPDSSFEGNLVPLTGGIVYEENPIISYTPVQGPEYLRQLMSPIPLDITALLFGATRHSPQVTSLLIKRINGIQNPDFVSDPAEDAGERFARVAELLAALDRRGAITWAQDGGGTSKLALLVHRHGPASQDANELASLVGITPPPDTAEFMTIPMTLGVGVRHPGSIDLTTASVFDLFELAAASVDVPNEHVESGLARPSPPTRQGPRSIHIRCSSARPSTAMVAVKYHGWWYAIDSADGPSKDTFRLLETLLTARIAETIRARDSTPVLTVPVSR
jgi:hypothetical protein